MACYIYVMSLTGTRILIIDDDEHLVALLSMKLSKVGYKVDEATTAAQGYKLAVDNDYDVIVLDLVMPKQSGLEVCQQLRSNGILTPILILSGRTDKNIVVRGLEAVADDYLTKPFSGNELVARIRALLRRNKKTFQAQLLERFGIELDILTNEARRGNKTVNLTKKETLLLQRLMSEAPKPVSRNALLQDVWGIGNSIHASNRLDVYIRRLRSKLKSLDTDGSQIHTVRGSGYNFDDA
jgi:DNA-binding response OmpR family regulator